jgi:hypothetical protein
VDNQEAKELCLYIDNEQAYYKQKLVIYKALAKKKDSNKYIHDKAPKAFSSLLATAAKSYVREFGSMGDKWDRAFTVVARKHAADQLAEQFLDWYREDWKASK